MELNFDTVVERLKKVMDIYGVVNIFVSEGYELPKVSTSAAATSAVTTTTTTTTEEPKAPKPTEIPKRNVFTPPLQSPPPPLSLAHVPTDPFGHIALSKVNIGQQLVSRLQPLLNSTNSIVEKSGYYARSAAAGPADTRLIASYASVAVDSALDGVSGCVGEDTENGNNLGIISFERIKGEGKMNTSLKWFTDMMRQIDKHGRVDNGKKKRKDSGGVKG